MLKFNKEKCLQDLKEFFEIREPTAESLKWINDNDGKKVINGKIKGTPWVANKEWCIEVPDEEKKPKVIRPKKEKPKSRFRIS
jgi:hypothetical protein